MTYFDVFNGDADGICALHQLRLETPRDAVLVTGAKRDIALLQRVPASAGDVVTVLDVSAATNHDALVRLLEREVVVHYFDHHFAGKLPAHPNLTATIDTSPGVCTGALVDRSLDGRQRIWAVVAAFGDNLPQLAHAVRTPNAESGYTVSIRAPVAAPRGADAFCRGYATGGGRAGAAGIDHLPRDALPEFIHRFERSFG